MVSKVQAALFLFIMVFFVLIACLAFQTLSSMLISEDSGEGESSFYSDVPTITISDSPTPPPSVTPTPVQVDAPSPVVIADTPTVVVEIEEGPEVALTATKAWETLLTPQASITPTQIVSDTSTTAPPPTATSVPSGDYLYVQDGDVRPDTSQGCFAGTIVGLVRAADGSSLEGVRIRIDSEWTEPQIVETKGGIDGYNAIVSSDPGIVYSVVVVDEGGQPISPVAQVIRYEGEPACWFELNWRRTH
jgi:hypothetical protein